MSCVTRRRFARPPCEDPRDSTSWYRNLDFLSALTCPTPSHYSIIYYRCSLWESKHRSHVTLCDQSNDGGGTSSSSSSSSRIPLLPSFVRSPGTSSPFNSWLGFIHQAVREFVASFAISPEPRCPASIFLSIQPCIVGPPLMGRT